MMLFVIDLFYLSLSFQDRAFLGVSTLKELVLKRPQGPEGPEDFLQALLEVTMGDIELVSFLVSYRIFSTMSCVCVVRMLYSLLCLFQARIQALHIAKKFYAKPELASKIEVGLCIQTPF